MITNKHKTIRKLYEEARTRTVRRAYSFFPLLTLARIKWGKTVKSACRDETLERFSQTVISALFLPFCFHGYSSSRFRLRARSFVSPRG